MLEMRREVEKILKERDVPCLKLHGEYGALELSTALQRWPEIFSTLLSAEELQMSFDIAIYDMHVKEPLQPTFAIGVSKLFSLEVPGVAEKRPSVLRGDAVLVISKTGRFKAYVHRVQLDRVDLSFHQTFDNNPPFEVKFFFTRTPLKLMHRALADTSDRVHFVYSREPGQMPTAAPVAAPGLNEEQSRFVETVVRARRITRITLSAAERELNESLSGATSTARDRRLMKGGETLLYHQTDTTSAQRILESGRMFRGRTGALGGGIYFAKTPADTHRKAHHHGPILECLVKLGRIKEVTTTDSTITFTKLQSEGFDSVLYKGFPSGPEYVAYNFDQVKPVCIHGQHQQLVPSVLPLLLWGPPGTGKTTTPSVTTLVAAIHKVLQIPGAKVLATAPSNAAADLICEKLGAAGIVKMLRLNGMLRNEADVPPSVKPFTRRGQAGFDTFSIPSLEELQSFDIIVSTCTAAGYLASQARLPGWFTHVFVDEAAQALEPEVLIPISVAEAGALVVLAGDFKQLGPVIRSPEAAQRGLDTSLLERVVQHIGIDHRRVHTLLRSYRAHPSIMHIYNITMYGGMLQCSCPASSYDMTHWSRCSLGAVGTRHPVIFHHVCGSEARESTSPSWSNPDEVEVLRTYVQELSAMGVPATDVGIITPYQLQCKRLRLMCKTEQFPALVGTTEQFQGRENRIILISTVRSRQENEVPMDLKFALGFVGNEKRSNVALSRARSMLVLVGNLRLLSADSHWNKIIRLAAERGYCSGQPFELQRPWIIDGRASQTASGAEQELVSRPWLRLE
ncbi:mov10b.2 [Symbiodinium sp. CCMP2456]|nr:mov10b.2 [Symbiodinium sp. CCMP2456]